MDTNNNLQEQVTNELENNTIPTETDETNQVETNDMMELEELFEENINVDDVSSFEAQKV